jgi:hypothetical protein
MFHDDHFSHSINIKGIISTTCEAIVLELLMRGNRNLVSDETIYFCNAWKVKV